MRRLQAVQRLVLAVFHQPQPVFQLDLSKNQQKAVHKVAIESIVQLISYN